MAHATGAAFHREIATALSRHAGGIGVGLLWLAAGVSMMTPGPPPPSGPADRALERMMETVDRGPAVALSVAPNGDVWWITARQAVRFEAGAPSQRRVAIDLRGRGAEFLGEYDPIAAAHVAADGALWMGTRHGAVWSHRDGAWRSHEGAFAARDEAVAAIVTHGEDVYVAGRGLWRGSREGLLTEVPAFAGARVSHAVAHPEFGVAVIARGRVWRGDPSGWRAVWDARRGGGGSLSALAVAPDGELWIGTQSGLVRIDRDGRERRDLTGTSIVSLAVGEHGSAHVGTRNAGLFARYAQQWRAVDAAGVRTVAHVARLASAPDGALWLALGSGDLLRAGPATPPLAHVSTR